MWLTGPARVGTPGPWPGAVLPRSIAIPPTMRNQNLMFISSSKPAFRRRPWAGCLSLGLAVLVLTLAGCQLPSVGPMSVAPEPASAVPVGEHFEDIPRELALVSLPSYRVGPPDVLLIDAVKVVPKEPYRIEPLDVLSVQITGDPDGPLTNSFLVGAGGSIDLGARYGLFRVEGSTVSEAASRLEAFLEETLTDAQVSISLAEPAAKQRIEGEHLVGPDGTVNLGTYGNVYISGMTLVEVRAAIENHLSQFLDEPEVGVDVFAYNSMSYYVVLQGAGQGDQVQRIPLTGGETVLDAIAELQGLAPISSRKIWIARPAPDKLGYDQILEVDWPAITKLANTSTNYQILPGDRVFVAENQHIALNNFVNRLLDPVERAVGFSLLGAQTIQTFNRFPNGLRQGQNF